ncbi:hypothetical protein QQX98_006744 [Neonectria punicea]|uniref:Uncharacterized protein n=1 Tax=Neonectria punicea TaxID=979145 RepID=A0ABR1H0H1_9HYPO
MPSFLSSFLNDFPEDDDDDNDNDDDDDSDDEDDTDDDAGQASEFPSAFPLRSQADSGWAKRKAGAEGETASGDESPTAAGAVWEVPCSACVTRMGKDGAAGLCRDQVNASAGGCAACARVHKTCVPLPFAAVADARALVEAL